jgi:hypothetical protein
MRALRFAVGCLCALLFAAGAALADSNTGIVYVHVLNAKDGKPASGWTVQLTGRDGDSVALTGSNGQANFLTVTPGMARIDVLQRGQLGACPAIVVVSANEETIINVHVKHLRAKQTFGCKPVTAKTLVRPGVTSDVYDIY